MHISSSSDEAGGEEGEWRGRAGGKRGRDADRAECSRAPAGPTGTSRRRSSPAPLCVALVLGISTSTDRVRNFTCRSVSGHPA